MKSLLILLSSLGALASAEAVSLPTSLQGIDVVSKKEIRVSLNSALESDLVVVVFVSARCPCSASHEDALKSLRQDYPQVQFVAVHSNQDEDAALTHEHFKTSALPFPVIEDPRAELANALGALKTPHAYVIRKGEILYQGGVDDSSAAPQAKNHFLRDALDALVHGRTPPLKQARALGCLIRRS